ncbi:hypothetical protein ACQ4WQ_28295 [Janthinobacterium sp. GB1R12]|uniref:hypothetical protein n=1 Tax=Janthinobacterium sp. GB1R12 TaxID=3424190 RepID=UPI003F29F180
MSYFDPHAQAQANGYQHGRIEGERAGFRNGQEQGYQAGYEAGHALGYDKGWNDCVQVANGEMSKQMQFTKQHISEKNLLQKQLTDAQWAIRLYVDKVNEVARENEEQKALIQSLRETIQRLVAERK